MTAIFGTPPLRFLVQKSQRQIKLEENGCLFSGQNMDGHEEDKTKKCFCGRPLANFRKWRL